MKRTFARYAYVLGWRLRYLWMDTPLGPRCRLTAAALVAAFSVWHFVDRMRTVEPGQPVQAFWEQIAILVISMLISYALTPKTPDAVDQPGQAPKVEDGAGVRMVFGEVWITDPAVIGWKKIGTQTIRGKKSGFNGRPIIGYWYKQLFHFVLCRGPVDAVLEFRGGDKVAWAGELTAGGDVQINKKDLWGGTGTGGEGGIEGPMQFLFGDAAQMPNAYLASALGSQQPAYRGLLTALFKGGLWGAFSPYPKAASFKVRRILQGWERATGAWYPERAVVPVSEDDRVLIYAEKFVGGVPAFTLAQGSVAPFAVVDTPYGKGMQTSGSSSGVIKKALSLSGRVNRLEVVFRVDSVGADDFCTLDFFDSTGRYIVGFNICREAAFAPGRPPSAYFSIRGAGENTGTPLGAAPVNVGVWYRFTAIFDAVARNYECRITSESDGVIFYTGVVPLGGGSGVRASADQIVFRKEGGAGGGTISGIELSLELDSATGGAMNPAHILYQSITDSWMGAEPEAQISDASLRAAADVLYAEGFGLCTEWISSDESVESFQQRVCDVIGGNLSRSPIDGKWYLDLIRGGYDTALLPVLIDDDILDYTEQPGTLVDTVNQVIVEWRDPQQREDRSTAPVQSLGSIQAAGAVIGEVATYREIPEESLALRVAGRNLQSKCRPLRRITGKVTRVAHAWRPGQVISLQSTKRGIASMHCRVGDIDRGTLRSGAISLTLLQDVFGLPQTVYVQPEAGAGTGDDDAPKPVAAAAVQEVPYALLAGMLPPGELTALTPDAGYLFAVATPAGAEFDYNLLVDAGTGYEQQAESDWSATATNAFACDRTANTISIVDARAFDDVVIGSMVLWGSEICRLDAVDIIAGTVTLGRGCADTVPFVHAPGERMWVIDDSIALDVTRYSDGATVSAKLLPRTSSQRLDLAAATAMPAAFASRANRPYPPAALRCDGALYPPNASVAVVLTWAHRDRLQQADQNIDNTHASIGPEPGTTYTVHAWLGDVLIDTQAGITGTSATVTPLSSGQLRVAVESARGGATSWQAATHTMAFSTAPYDYYVNESGDRYVDESGNYYIRG